MNQAIDLINEMMHDLDIISCDFSKDWELKRTYDAMKWILKEARDKISSLPSDTQWIDAIKRVQSLIDIELYDHDWASINTSYLRWLEAALWEIKWEPPERNLIS